MKSFKLTILENIFNSMIRGHQRVIDRKSERYSFQLQEKDNFMDSSERMVKEIDKIKKNILNENEKCHALEKENTILEKKENESLEFLRKENIALKSAIEKNSDLEVNKKTNELQIAKIKSELEELNEKISQESKGKISIENKIQKQQEKISSTRVIINDTRKLQEILDSDVLALNEDLGGHDFELERRTKELDCEKGNLSISETRRNNAQLKVDQIENRLESIKLERNDILKTQLFNTNEIEEQEISFLRLEVEIEDSENLIESENAKKVKLEGSLKELKIENESSAEELGEYKRELIELTNINQSLKNRHKKLLENESIINDQLLSSNEHYEKLSKEITKTKKEIELLDSTLSTQSNSLLKLNDSVDQQKYLKKDLGLGFEKQSVDYEELKLQLSKQSSEESILTASIKILQCEVASLITRRSETSKSLTKIEINNEKLNDELSVLKVTEFELLEQNTLLSEDLKGNLERNFEMKKAQVILNLDISKKELFLKSMNLSYNESLALRDKMNTDLDSLTIEESKLSNELLSLSEQMHEHKSLIKKSENQAYFKSETIEVMKLKLNELQKEKDIVDEAESLLRTGNDELSEDISSRVDVLDDLSKALKEKKDSVKELVFEKNRIINGLISTEKDIDMSSSSIDELARRSEKLKLENVQQEEFLIERTSELSKRRADFVRLKEEYSLNSIRAKDLKKENTLTMRELSTIEDLISLEKKREISSLSNDVLEDNNFLLEIELEKKNQELNKLIDNKVVPQVSRRSPRTC